MVVFHYSCRHAGLIVDAAKRLSQDFKVAQDHTPAASRPLAVWLPPALDELKLNVDTTFCASESKGQRDMVVRDHHGQIVVAARKTSNGITCSLHTELMTLLFGLEVVHSQGIWVQFVMSNFLLAILEINKGAI